MADALAAGGLPWGDAGVGATVMLAGEPTDVADWPRHLASPGPTPTAASRLVVQWATAILTRASTVAIRWSSWRTSAIRSAASGSPQPAAQRRAWRCGCGWPPRPSISRLTVWGGRLGPGAAWSTSATPPPGPGHRPAAAAGHCGRRPRPRRRRRIALAAVPGTASLAGTSRADSPSPAIGRLHKHAPTIEPPSGTRHRDPVTPMRRQPTPAVPDRRRVPWP
jgi:hypothetical protein